MLLFFRYVSELMLPFGSLLFVALVVQLFAFHGMRWNYGSSAGAATFGYGLAAVIFFIVAMVLAPVSTNYIYPYGYDQTWGLALTFASWVALGVLFILEGVSYLSTRYFMGNPALSTSVGVLFIVGGSFISTVFLAIYGGFFVMVPAFILGGILHLGAPLPPAQLPQATA